MPLQASIARRVTVWDRDASGSYDPGVSGPLGDSELAAGWLLQHDARAGSWLLQHEGFLGAGNAITKPSARASRATRCSSAASTAEWTLCNFAHASLSASVWQQQLEKHCSAVAHPQGLSMHGNGFERSLPASRLAAGESVASAHMFPSGKGKPEATSE